jgi:hypothetical protein
MFTVYVVYVFVFFQGSDVGETYGFVPATVRGFICTEAGPADRGPQNIGVTVVICVHIERQINRGQVMVNSD